jgi:hypothetical protein
LSCMRCESNGNITGLVLVLFSSSQLVLCSMLPAHQLALLLVVLCRGVHVISAATHLALCNSACCSLLARGSHKSLVSVEECQLSTTVKCHSSTNVFSAVQERA